MIRHAYAALTALFMFLLAPASLGAAERTIEIPGLGKTFVLERVMLHTAMMDYLARGNRIETGNAAREMHQSLQAFDAASKKIFRDGQQAKPAGVDRLVKIFKEPYRLENARSATELLAKIDKDNDQTMHHLKRTVATGNLAPLLARAAIARIAEQYMMAYAGLNTQDSGTQKKAIQTLEDQLKTMKAFPDNTADMAQILTDTENLWRLMRDLYAGIGEGDLPVTVFQTTRQLDTYLERYGKMALSAKHRKDIP